MRTGPATLTSHLGPLLQLVGYLEGDVWKKYARNANVQAASLAKGLAALPGFSLLYPTGTFSVQAIPWTFRQFSL